MSDKPTRSGPEDLPRGLSLLGPGTTAAARRRARIFAAVMALTTAALVWPGYMLASGIHPMILGLPLSLAWIIGWLFVTLGALIWMYRAEGRETGSAPPGEPR